METLQSNFTTPEQSKRLLEMGVPADSADCYYQNALPEPKIIPSNRKYKEYINSRTGLNRGIWYFKPCWSVGRLQEIAKICAKEKEYYYASLDTVAHQEDFVEWWVKHFTLTDNVLFDFSKLED